MSDYPPPPNSSDFPPKGADYPPPGSQQPQEPRGYQDPPPPPQQPSYPPPGSDQPRPYNKPPAEPNRGPSRSLPGDDLMRDDIGRDRRRPNRIELDPAETPDFRRDIRQDDEFRGQRVSREPLLTERQVEAIGWGLTVILFGFSILLSYFLSDTNFLTVGFPILGGMLLLAASVYQRINGWRVASVTWLTAIGLSAFSITRLLAILDGEETNIIDSLAYFFGIFAIITGTIVLVRIFQQR